MLSSFLVDEAENIYCFVVSDEGVYSLLSYDKTGVLQAEYELQDNFLVKKAVIDEKGIIYACSDNAILFLIVTVMASVR